ncbi:Acyl-coenzyme A thioesterase 4 [Collichthys lucidus]|uniref:Acyl-coenzyme A thioesterase 4 n=1 Tax=Collichthys lucidus TaxID=240159 RepID=A0A4U5UHZ1_COLLU|nr:Acyl-coenzyme A thioesterase 4 [Collichthys lucidus]
MTIHALHKCEDGHSYEAFAHYTANATGTVNVSEDPSLGGTYSGVEQMGLLWSVRPVPGSKPGVRLRKVNVQTPMEVTISVYQGHQTEGFMDQVPLVGVLVERWYMAPGIRRIPITEDGLTATLFLPSGPGPFPGLLDLWGGEGKLIEYRAALLASHGIACLTLDYLTPEITMETGKMVDSQYIEVGRLQCPLLLVVGEDDQNWPAYESAMDMKEMMEKAGNSHLLTVLSYLNAGHLIEPPYTPHTRATAFCSAASVEEVMALWGGETVAHSRTQEDAWKKMLTFLKENLYGSSNCVF